MLPFGMEIRSVDVHDDTEFHAFHEIVEAASHESGRRIRCGASRRPRSCSASTTAS